MFKLSTGTRNLLAGINTELATNGAVDSVTTGWTAVDSTLTVNTGSPQEGAGNLRVAESGGANPGKAYQNITTKIGHLYKVTVYHKKGTADYGKIMVGSSVSEASYYDSGNLNDAAWTQKTIYFVPTTVTSRITLETVDATGGEYTEFDTITCTYMERSLQGIFKNCLIEIRSGSMPSSPDDDVSGTLLVTLCNGGDLTVGLTWDDAVAGVLNKKSTETWQDAAVATGTAGWFRIKHIDDAGGSSAIHPRFDGDCATSGAAMNLSNVSITNGAVQTLASFYLTVPQS